MISRFIKARSRQFCRALINQGLAEIDENDLRKSAIIFSPHQDDETLACGGTIIRKKKAGAHVSIVFMTDGRRSHNHLFSEKALKSIRANEALAATQILGVREKDVIFLEFEDGELENSQGAAIQKVTEILLCRSPEEVFIPYFRDDSFEHSVTNRIVISALQMYLKKTLVYEYPVWFWFHWPWVSVPIGSRREILRILKDGLILNVLCFRDFRYGVVIRDVIQSKRAALDRYRSQMTKLIPDPRWKTLGEISDGEFLECFFHEHEIFRRWVHSGDREPRQPKDLALREKRDGK